MNIHSRCLFAMLLAAAGHLCSNTALAGSSASAFTFQGRLTEAGAPMAGPVDLRITPFDQAADGVPLAPAVEFNALAPDGGVFSVAVDFGAGVFDGAPVWLEVAVRGPTAFEFTVLSPRQAVSSAPYALLAHTVAVNAVDGFALQDAAVGPGHIAPGAVGAAQVDASEVQLRVANACPAGSAISAIAASGIPTCTPVDPAAGGVHYIVLSQGDFQPSDTARTVLRKGYVTPAGSTISSSQLSLVAPLHLPDGAVITGLAIWYQNRVAPRMLFAVRRRAHGASGTTSIGSFSPVVDGGSAVLQYSTTLNHVVDAGNYAYEATVGLAASGSWLQDNHNVHAMRIAYTVP